MLTQDDVKKINELSSGTTEGDKMGNYDERYMFVDPLGSPAGDGVIIEGNLELFGSQSEFYG